MPHGVCGDAFTVFVGKRCKEFLLVIPEACRVIAIEICYTQPSVRGIGMQPDSFHQTVQAQVGEGIRFNICADLID